MSNPFDGDVTVGQLQDELFKIGTALREKYGKRAAIVLMLGTHGAPGHDVFAAYHNGPCLYQRGLVAWGAPRVLRSIDEEETASPTKRG
jgi:hypothetical protein